jgi:hypothetical protein
MNIDVIHDYKRKQPWEKRRKVYKQKKIQSEASFVIKEQQWKDFRIMNESALFRDNQFNSLTIWTPPCRYF